MTTHTLHRHVTADASHTIHITLPPDMSAEVDVVVTPRSVHTESPESIAVARLQNQTGFARQVLNSPEEDCWNDL